MPTFAKRSIVTATKGTVFATLAVALAGIGAVMALYVVPSWSKVTTWLMMTNARYVGSVGEPDPFTGKSEIEYGIVSYWGSVALWLLLCVLVASIPAIVVMKFGAHKPDGQAARAG